MISGLFPTGRTMGAMPVSSAVAMQASAVSTVIEPCSLSSRIQSNPRWPSISTAAGDGKVHMTPNAALPAWSRCLSVFSRMLFLREQDVRRGLPLAAAGAGHLLAAHRKPGRPKRERSARERSHESISPGDRAAAESILADDARTVD